MFNILLFVDKSLPNRVTRPERVNEDRKHCGSSTLVFWVSLILRGKRPAQVSYYPNFHNDVYFILA